MVMATVVAVVVVMVVLRVLFDFSFIFGQTTLSFRILHVSTRSLTANYKYQPIQLATERKKKQKRISTYRKTTATTIQIQHQKITWNKSHIYLLDIPFIPWNRIRWGCSKTLQLKTSPTYSGCRIVKKNVHTAYANSGSSSCKPQKCAFLYLSFSNSFNRFWKKPLHRNFSCYFKQRSDFRFLYGSFEIRRSLIKKFVPKMLFFPIL